MAAYEPPLRVLHSLRGVTPGKPFKRRPSPLVMLAAFGALVAVATLVWWLLGPTLLEVSAQSSRRFAVLVIGGPLFLVAVILKGLYTMWRERPTAPFEFPFVVDLPGWFRWTSHGDEILYLTRKHSMICLFRRETTVDLATVLDELDPDRELETDAATHDRISVELPAEDGNDDAPPRAVGFIHQFSAMPFYALVLAAEAELAAELGHKITSARFRTPGEPPQKWRELVAPSIAADARVVSQA